MKVYKAMKHLSYTDAGKRILVPLNSRWLLVDQLENKNVNLEIMDMGHSNTEVMIDEKTFEEHFKLVEIACDICDSHDEELYTFECQDLCLKCLMRESDEVCAVEKVEYFVGGEYAGCSENFEEVQENIVNNLEVKIVKVGE